MRKLFITVLLILTLATPAFAFWWFGDPNTPPEAGGTVGGGPHYLLIDGATHYLLIDGATNQLRIDATTS